MNIFFIDLDARKAAEQLVDKHVVKMIVETAQLLSTAHRVLDGIQVQIQLEKDGKTRNKKVWILPDDRNHIFYKATHINHPCALWCRESVENYNWLVDHLFALSDEYTYRYGKNHKTIQRLGYEIQSPPFNLKEWDWTNPPLAMPDEYKSDDFVESYRNYYREEKKHLHKWKNRGVPEWIMI